MRKLVPVMVAVQTALAPAMAQSQPTAPKQYEMKPSLGTCPTLSELMKGFLERGEWESGQVILDFMRRKDVGCDADAERLQRQMDEMRQRPERPVPDSGGRILQG